MKRKAASDIAEVLARLSDPTDVQAFLVGILTPSERDRIGLRWQIVQLLAQGMPQRGIAQKLGVSLCNITRGSYELQHGPRRFRRVVDRVAKVKKGG